MIRINNITRGRFGNRILQYNNLMQIARLAGTEASCAKWEGHDIFKDLVIQKSSPNPQVILDWRSVLSCDMTTLPNDNDFYIDDPAYCLHNVFYKLAKENPRTFLTIKDKHKKEFTDDNVHVGIHIRGGDFITADEGKEIHEFEFYKDSIELVKAKFGNDVCYHVCTDDPLFSTYSSTIEYLKINNFKFDAGSVNDLYSDFATLCECDVLILSSSTFGMCAAFIGKEDKKIIHSNKWIQRNLDHIPWNDTKCENTRKRQISFDNFWVELYNGGNRFYQAWSFV